MYKRSIGLRFVAYLIDFLMLYVVGIFMHILFGFGTLIKTATTITFYMSLFEMTVAAVVYFMLFAILTKGLTIGKLLTTVRIKYDNLKETDRQSIIYREFVKSALILISLISFIVVLVRNDRKAIHDIIVDTIVVRKSKRNDYVEIPPENNERKEMA